MCGFGIKCGSSIKPARCMDRRRRQVMDRRRRQVESNPRIDRVGWKLPPFHWTDVTPRLGGTSHLQSEEVLTGTKEVAAMVVRNHQKKRDDDFGSFARALLRNSMLTGIPQIAKTSSTPKRWLRTLVFMVCVVGFVYQTGSFMSLYYQYKTVLDIQVVLPKEVDLPAISVCSPNAIMANKICNESSPWRKDCWSLRNRTEVDWCSCQPRYCKHHKQQVKDVWLPSEALYNASMNWTFEQQKDFLQSFESMFSSCWVYGRHYNICNTSNHQNFAVWCPEAEIVANCYSVGTLIGVPDGVPERDLSRSSISFMLFPDAENYLMQNRFVEHQVQFHHPKAFVDPYGYGHAVYPGVVTNFWFKKTTKRLLPPPYETDCRDYLSEWKARGGHGPTDQKTCISECWANASLQIMSGCLLRPFLHPYTSEYPRCDGWYDYETFPNITQLGEECEKDCRPACYEETYTVLRRDSIKIHEHCTEGLGLEDFSSVFMKFDGMETTIYTYSPKFQVIEIFSYLGGYMGMWLGISLVAAFDFLDTLLQLCRYSTRNKGRTTPVRMTL